MSETRKVHVLRHDRVHEVVTVCEQGHPERRYAINSWELRPWYRHADGYANWRFEEVAE